MRRAMEDLRHQGRQRVAALITEGIKHTLQSSSPHILSTHPLHTFSTHLSTHLLHEACGTWHDPSFLDFLRYLTFFTLPHFFLSSY